MQDLDERIRALRGLDRLSLIRALTRIDAQLQQQARMGRRAKRGSNERDRAEQAKGGCDRLGRMIYFLRFRSPATDATDEDMALCINLWNGFEQEDDGTVIVLDVMPRNTGEEA
jgi:hypothetical protein